MSEAQTVGENKVVALEYVLRDPEGQELDRSAPENPLSYLHGAGNIVPGLEKQIEGKGVGDAFIAIVSPEEGYGPKIKVKPMKVRRSQLPAEMEIARGVCLGMQSPEGQTFPVWVESIQGATIVLTPLHPLAGVELHFDVKVIEIRDASEEEIAHGHPHGPGGHHH